MTEPITYVATYSDGSQDLVTIWPDGTAEIAARRNQFHTWGLPTEMRKADATDAHLPGYFIAPDANNDLQVWRERGDYPVPVLGQFELRDDPDVWDVLAAAIREVIA